MAKINGIFHLLKLGQLEVRIGIGSSKLKSDKYLRINDILVKKIIVLSNKETAVNPARMG